MRKISLFAVAAVAIGLGAWAASTTNARIAPPMGHGIEPFQLMINAKELPTTEFADYTFVFRWQWESRSQSAKPMTSKADATTVTLSRRDNHSMDRAMKAGIGATACSVLIVALVLLAMHAMPVSIGWQHMMKQDPKAVSLNERVLKHGEGIMKKLIAVLALATLIAVPTFDQSGNAAPMSPASSSFGGNGY
jgi:hypothetical protein